MAKKEIVKWIILGGGILLLLALLATFVIVGGRSVTDPSVQNGEKISLMGGAETVNILVAGTDRASGLCDVLMLFRWERETGRVCVLQIPRDTYAAYTESSYRKLNGAMRRLGGMKPLGEFLSEALGVKVDRYVLLDLDVLRQIVDEIGGVSITLPDALHYEDPAQGLSIHLSEGTQTLDGRQAEYFVRYRMGYVRGDLGRMDAQKLFLAAFAKQLRESLGLSSALRLAKDVLPKIETDLTLWEATSLVRSAFSASEDAIFLMTLPGEEAIAEQSGASYYVLSSVATEELLVRYFGASSGKFDRYAVFRNSKYRRFCEIYDGYLPYDVYSMGQIEAEGIEIEKTHR